MRNSGSPMRRPLRRAPPRRAPHREQRDGPPLAEGHAGALRLERLEVEVPRRRAAVAADAVPSSPRGADFGPGCSQLETAKTVAGDDESGARRQSGRTARREEHRQRNGDGGNRQAHPGHLSHVTEEGGESTDFERFYEKHRDAGRAYSSSGGCLSGRRRRLADFDRLAPTNEFQRHARLAPRHRTEAARQPPTQ